jgi:hypothetical protein
MHFEEDLLIEVELRYCLVNGLLQKVPVEIAEESAKMIKDIPELLTLYNRLFLAYHKTFEPYEYLALESVLKRGWRDLKVMNQHLKVLANLLRLEQTVLE